MSSLLEQHGHLGTQNALGGKDLGKGWRALTLENGQMVYYNALTNKSQWQIPPEIVKADEAGKDGENAAGQEGQAANVTSATSAFSSHIGGSKMPTSLL